MKNLYLAVALIFSSSAFGLVSTTEDPNWEKRSTVFIKSYASSTGQWMKCTGTWAQAKNCACHRPTCV
jgi:hypothetical protein